MINIIFLLLIFFMLTGTIQMKQITLIEKPLSQYSTKDSHNDKNLLLISLDSNENFYLNNELILIEELEKRIIEQEINQKIFLDLDKKSKIVNLNKIIRVLKTFILLLSFFISSPANKPERVVAVNPKPDKNQVYCLPSSKAPKIK